MTMLMLLKENISLGLAYSFRSLVHYHHGGEAWQHAGRHGADEEAEIYRQQEEISTLGVALSI